MAENGSIKYKSVIYNHPIWGRNICIERKWDSIEEELEDKQKTYVRENDPWNKLRMYVDMVLSRPKRTRLALCDVCGAYEYMDESAVVALPSAMDAVYSLITQSVVLEEDLRAARRPHSRARRRRPQRPVAQGAQGVPRQDGVPHEAAQGQVACERASA